jgi:HK97 family phage major capsid protein
MKKSEKLIAEMQGKWKEIEGIRDAVVKEEREFTPDEKARVEATLDEVRGIEVQVKKEQENEALVDQINGFNDLFAPQVGGQKNGNLPNGNRQQKQKLMRVGQQFETSEVWRKWYEKSAVAGRIPDSLKHFNSPQVEMGDLLQKAFQNGGRKQLIAGDSDTSAGAFVTPDYTSIYEPLGRYMLTMRNLVTVRTTGSDLVSFVRQTTQVTEAATVAEANTEDYTGATGQVSGEKPLANLAWVRVNEAVKTIAIMAAATRQALADAGQLRGIIDDDLMSDAAEELENQMLNGDGIGENFTGLNNTSGTLAQAFDTDIAVTARKAITNLLINGKQMPTAWLLNPQDWETFDLLTDSNGRYYWGGPMAQGQRTLWGVPVAQSFFQAQGTGWLGNWTKAVLWDRMAATMYVTDSHSDWFRKNIIAILAELRAAFGVIRPTAFCEVDLDSGS